MKEICRVRSVNPINIYFWLRFSLANAIKCLLKVKNSCCVCREFSTFNTYLLNLSYQISVGFIFVYQKSLKRTFKTGFWVQNHRLNLLWIHKGYCVVKKLVWNVRIKSIWCTKQYILSFPIAVLIQNKRDSAFNKQSLL